MNFNKENIVLGSLVFLNGEDEFVKKNFKHLIGVEGIVVAVSFGYYVKEHFAIVFKNRKYIGLNDYITENRLIPYGLQNRVINSKHLLIEKNIISPIDYVKSFVERKSFNYNYFLMSFSIYYSHLIGYKIEYHKGSLKKYFIEDCKPYNEGCLSTAKIINNDLYEGI